MRCVAEKRKQMFRKRLSYIVITNKQELEVAFLEFFKYIFQNKCIPEYHNVRVTARTLCTGSLTPCQELRQPDWLQ